MISFRIDWFDLLAVQGTLKSLLQHHSLVSISSSALRLFYILTLTSIMTTRKTTSLTIWTFVGKMMSLLFNMLSRFVIAFLPRNKQASFNFVAALTHSAMTLEPKKIKL